MGTTTSSSSSMINSSLTSGATFDAIYSSSVIVTAILAWTTLGSAILAALLIRAAILAGAILGSAILAAFGLTMTGGWYFRFMWGRVFSFLTCSSSVRDYYTSIGATNEVTDGSFS
jgi:hypothetical protein